MSKADEIDTPEAIARLSVLNLFKLWQSHDAEQWSNNYSLCGSFAQRALKLGEPLLAYDVLDEGLKIWVGDVRLRQLHALALARTGATLRANSILVELRAEGHQDAETLGLLARTHKDLWLQSSNDSFGLDNLRSAYELYLEAYQKSGGYWAGINAATLALSLGKSKIAGDLAREVSGLCMTEISRSENAGLDDYWLLATLGEAALVRAEWSDAEAWYRKASEAAKGQYAELASTRRNARLIAKALGEGRERIDSFLQIPDVILFTGHMIDSPERAISRFPPQLEPAVRAAIRERLVKMGVGIGYSSAACGSDILFLEIMNELGSETHIVLPYDRDQFIRDSVEIIPDAGWKERFDAVMRNAASVTMASDNRLERGDISLVYANQLIQGLGRIRASELETGLVPLAVWDSSCGDGEGGTSSVVDQWRANRFEVELIDLAAMYRGGQEMRKNPSAATDQGSANTKIDESFNPKIMSMLFADAVNFSKLTEAQVPLFLRHFLGLIGDLAATSRYSPAMKNTWGDGLFFVFRSVSDAGNFALELCQRLNETKWEERGLPEALNLRIALHAGPVYECEDPVTKRVNFFGSHVSRAARLEPMTPPGQVYSSQAFAALAAAHGIMGFSCDYVGQTPLDKHYGTFPIYHVRSI